MWIFGISSYLGIMSNIIVELGAIHQGMIMTNELGDIIVVLESNSIETMNLIKSGDMSTHQYGVVVEDIRRVLDQKPNLSTAILVLLTFSEM